MRAASGFKQDERLHSVDQPHSTEAHLENVETQVPRHIGGFRFFWRASALPLWPILAICVALVALDFICRQHSAKSLEGEMPRRRLAGEQEDPSESPPSPELELLCSLLGPWSPAETAPGDPRRSPHMVEAFFEAMETDTFPGSQRQSAHMVGEVIGPMETEGESGAVPSAPAQGATPEGATMGTLAGTATCGLGAEPPLPSSSGGDDKESGLSRRFSAYDGVLRMPQHPPRPSASVTAHPALPHPTKLKPVFGGLLPVSGDAPSTSTATPPPPAAQAPPEALLHPFVRVPPLQPGVIPRPWVPSMSPIPFSTVCSSQMLLRRIRELLLQPFLDAPAAEELILYAEHLAAYSIRRLSTATSQLAPADAVRNFGIRFIVLNSLHSAAQAIRPTPPPWWEQVTHVMLKDYKLDGPSPWRATGSNAALARDLAEALLKYKNGGSPTLAEVVDLKRRLLCNPNTVYYFQRPDWDPWREDDKPG